jgi:N-acetylmuramoyl-L-alanine amidase
MTFYSEMAATASELITEFGADVVLQRASGGAFDPATGQTTGVTTSELTAKGIHKRFKASLVDGTRIKHGDKLYVLNDSQVPAMSDKLKVGAEYWSIVNVDSIVPAGTAIVYFVQVRK